MVFMLNRAMRLSGEKEHMDCTASRDIYSGKQDHMVFRPHGTIRLPGEKQHMGWTASKDMCAGKQGIWVSTVCGNEVKCISG